MASELTVDLAKLETIFAQYGDQTGVLIPVLQAAQAEYGYLPSAVLSAIAERLAVPLSQVYGVVTFYSQFYLNPRGRHVIRCCDGTACHVRGTPKIVEALENHLGIRAGETTDDMAYTLEVVYCLGSCALAPVVVVDGTVMGGVTPERMLKVIASLDGADGAGAGA
ncbi:MAG: NADH-quinone oxidoreductase subunit NuoE [Anaerolineae bacterium]|nr:NADH-quinone oxidoreductase subunit NuoE [Anaerolineae bacterium]